MKNFFFASVSRSTLWCSLSTKFVYGIQLGSKEIIKGQTVDLRRIWLILRTEYDSTKISQHKRATELYESKCLRTKTAIEKWSYLNWHSIWWIMWPFPLSKRIHINSFWFCNQMIQFRFECIYYIHKTSSEQIGSAVNSWKFHWQKKKRECRWKMGWNVS